MYQPSYSQPNLYPSASYPQQYTQYQSQPVQFPSPSPYSPPQPLAANMPTYYVASSQPSRSRSHSQSHYTNPGNVYGNTLYPTTTGHRSSSRSRHGHSSSYGGYPSSGGYHSTHSSPGHTSSNYHSDGRRRHNSMSAGYGGRYYPPQQHSAPAYSTGHSPGHRRSHSTSRHPEQLRHHTGHSDGRHRNQYQYAQPSLGERLRNFFSSGPSQHHSSHRAEYIDARTGRPCDRHGRPIVQY